MSFNHEGYDSCHVKEIKNHIRITMGKCLKKIRERRGETQEVLAKALNISKSTINKYEAGVRSIPSEYIPIIAGRYKINTSLLFGNYAYSKIDLEYELYLEMIKKVLRDYKYDDYIYDITSRHIADYLQEILSMKDASIFDLFYTYANFLHRLKLLSVESNAVPDKHNKINFLYKQLALDLHKIQYNNYELNPSVYIKELLHTFHY